MNIMINSYTEQLIKRNGDVSCTWLRTWEIKSICRWEKDKFPYFNADCIQYDTHNENETIHCQQKNPLINDVTIPYNYDKNNTEI